MQENHSNHMNAIFIFGLDNQFIKVYRQNKPKGYKPKYQLVMDGS